MDCEDAKGKLLESYDSALSGDTKRQLETHLTACSNCARFAAALNKIDTQLKGAIVAPRLSRAFRAGLRARIDRQRRPVWAHWLPDAAYLAGSGAAIICCALLLPFPVLSVLWAGVLTATTGYSFQTLLLSSVEDL